MNKLSPPWMVAGMPKVDDRPVTRITRPGVVVVSHERSGTHFLMNALTGAYGYSTAVDLDSAKVPVNFFYPPLLARTIVDRAGRQANCIFKSHHAVEFFDGVLDDLLKAVVILYIHRDPVDVMISFWRLMHELIWREGPKAPSASEFAQAAPEGQMLRYQMCQQRTMLDRWARHVEGWVAAAEGRSRLVVVRYDELLANYEKTTHSLGRVLGPATGNFQPPPRDKHVVKGARPESLPGPDIDALRTIAHAEVGDAMRAFGYI